MACSKSVKASMASFIENFNSLDTNLWLVSDGYANPKGIYNATWRATNAAVDPVTGLLALSILPDGAPDATKPYAAGQLSSVNSSFGYGTYSVSMRAAPEPGVLSSFFISGGGTAGVNETDIQLGYFGDHSSCMLQCNYFSSGVGGNEQLIQLSFDATADFHVYTVIWTAGSLLWLVDGNQVAAASGNTPTAPGQIFVNCWPTTGNDAWAGAYSGNPTTALYDWLSYTPTGEDLVIGAASFSSDITAVFRNGGILVGTAILTNYGGTDAVLLAAKISSTDPFGNAVDFGLLTDVLIPAGQTVTVSMPRTFSSADAVGVWQGFFAYQGADGSWVQGNPFLFYVI
jgi:endo-1,3-1,4-beta-glycanase ExoK